MGHAAHTRQLKEKYVIPAGIAGIHDCTDAGGRATQEQLPRSHGWQILNRVINLAIGGYYAIRSTISSHTIVFHRTLHIPVPWIPAFPAGMTRYLETYAS
jgi:hypothetical protein